MTAFDKEHYLRRVSNRLRTFRAVAKKLGKDHKLVQMMGTLAWGRHDFEWGPDGDSLRAVIYAAGGLHGEFNVLNRWARDNDPRAQRVLLDTWRAENITP